MPQTYEELQQKIELDLAKAVDANRISKEDLMPILFLLGQTSTLLELETFVDIFSDSFPVLKTVQFEKRAQVKMNFEEKVRKVVSKLVFSDPKRAAEITKAALQKGATWEDLLDKYPELGNE